MMSGKVVYCVVLFPNDTSENKSIDVVPVDWLIYNDGDDKFECPFLNNYELSGENLLLLQDLVKRRAPAPDNWSLHEVDVRGYANTYQNALEKLKILQQKEYAFSTDNEETINRRQDVLKKQSRLNKGRFPNQNNVDQQLSECNISLGNNSRNASNLNELNALKSYIGDCYHKLSQQIGTMQGEIIKLQELVANMGTNPVVTFDEQEHGLAIPFKNLEDFQTFNENLKQNESLKKYVIHKIFSLLDKDAAMHITIKKVLERFTNKEVLKHFTASRPTANKLILKDTELVKCLYGIMNSESIKNPRLSPIKEQAFNQALGKVINLSRDWEHGRDHRRTNKT